MKIDISHISQEFVENSSFFKKFPQYQNKASEYVETHIKEKIKNITEDFDYYSLINQSIAENNLSLFKDLLSEYYIKSQNIEHMVILHRHHFFDYTVSNYPQIVLEQWDVIVKNSLLHDNMHVQKYILEQHSENLFDWLFDDFKSCAFSISDDNFSLYLKENNLIGASQLNAQIISGVLAALCYHKYLDRVKTLVSYCQEKQIALNDWEWSFVLANDSNDTLNNGIEAYNEFRHNTEIINKDVILYLLYDLNIPVNKDTMDLISSHNNSVYMEKLNTLIEQRDLFFSLELNLSPKQSQNKIKI